MREIPKLINSKDPEEVKMCWDKLRLLLHEILDMLERPPGAGQAGQAVWSVGSFFNGVLAVGQPNPRFVIPEDVQGFELTDLRITYQHGTPTDETWINVSLVSSGLSTLLGTSVLHVGAVADLLYTVSLGTPIPLQAGDLVKWECVQAGGHADVTATVLGRQAT